MAENHSSGHSNGASSWFPNTLAHGMPLALVGDMASSQYKLALPIAILLAVITSPRYTTKSAVQVKILKVRNPKIHKLHISLVVSPGVS